MRVSIGGFCEGDCDMHQAKESLEKYEDATVVATCIVCGESQKIEKMGDKCKNCGSTGEWK